jgi:hypothetical protein
MILCCVLLSAILGAQVTYFLIHKRHMPTVRASSGPALMFALLVGTLNIPFVGALQAAFFGATFVGMTDKSRLGWKRVFLASVIFGLIFTFLIPFAKGIGGGLGAAAFVSSAVVYTIGKIVKKLIKRSHP